MEIGELLRRSSEYGRRAGRRTLCRICLLCALCLPVFLWAAPARAAETGFSDVPETAWYADQVRRIQEEAPGTVSGMGDGTFQPEGSTTRAQFTKMLCAFSGEAASPDFEEAYGGPSSFSDVSGWAVPYVSWAAEQGLAEGTGNGGFSPARAVTREQLAVLLYRYAGQWDAIELRWSEKALAPFYDAWKASSWAEDALKWAVSNRIVNGYDAFTLGPEKPATRAQVVTMLCNYLDYRDGGWDTTFPEEEDPPVPVFSPKFTEIGGVRVIDAPFIDQRVKYPTGCESVTAVMALRYFGVDLSVESFIDRYLPRGNAPHYDGNGHYVGCDPRRAFPGDPYSYYGWGCYAPVIVGAAERALAGAGSPPLAVRSVGGGAVESLCAQYVDRGIPVLLWATIGMEAPQPSTVFTIEGTNEPFQWIYPMHCLLLIGRDSGYYYFNDPLEGKAVRYSKFAVERAYNGLKQQAVVFLPQ